MDTMEKTLAVWRVFEEFHFQGKVKYLGISNIYSLDALKHIYETVVIKPKFVQNRFYKQSGYDVGIRAFCTEKGIKYQSFWTLSANPSILQR